MTISAEIIADSISPSGVRLTTLCLNYQRFIHSEFMTHRMFSRGAASSRAIPVLKMLEQVQAEPAMPIHWGKNQPGMQAVEELDAVVGIGHWQGAADCMVDIAHDMSEDGYHKQIVNRLLEPFQWIKVIVTATEWDNFFALRLHKDAQPEMMVLAEHIKAAMEESDPVHLKFHEWHLPYVQLWEEQNDMTPELARKCSAARCARVSYLNHDNSTPNIDKDIALADKLLEAGHMSPFEHIATPMNFAKDTFELAWENGVTHKDRDNNFWSGNLRGFIQYRQLLNAE